MKQKTSLNLLKLGLLIFTAIILSGLGLAQDYPLFTEDGGEEPFTTDNYDVETNPPADIGDRSLNLSGETQDLSDLDEPIEAWFEVTVDGEDDWFEVDAGTVDGTQEFNAVAEDLEPGTDYRFQACTKDDCGADPVESTNLYSVSTLETQTEIGDRSLNFTGEVTGLTDLTDDIDDDISFYIEYTVQGEDDWIEVFDEDRTVDGVLWEPVTGLDPGTDYEFRAYSEDDIQDSGSRTTSTYDIDTGGTYPSSGDSTLTGKVSGLNQLTEDLNDEVEIDFEYELNDGTTETVTATSTVLTDGAFGENIEEDLENIDRFRAVSGDGLMGSWVDVNEGHDFPGSVETFGTEDFEVEFLEGETDRGSTDLNLTAETQQLSNLDEPIDAWFEIEESGGSYEVALDAGTVDSTEKFHAYDDGLEPDQTYEIEAYTEGGKMDSGTVTTENYEIETNSPISIASRSMRLEGETIDLSNLGDSVDVWFEVEEVEGSYEETVDAGTVDSSETFSRVVEDLDQSTDYSFEACTEDDCGEPDTATTSSYNVSTQSDVDVGTDWLRFRGELTDVQPLTTEIDDEILLQFQYREDGESEWQVPLVQSEEEFVEGDKREFNEDALDDADGILTSDFITGEEPEGYIGDGGNIHDQFSIPKGEVREYVFDEAGSGADYVFFLSDQPQNSYQSGSSVDGQVYEGGSDSHSLPSERFKVEAHYSSNGDTMDVYLYDEVEGGDIQFSDEDIDVSRIEDVYFSMYEWAGGSGTNSLRLINATEPEPKIVESEHERSADGIYEERVEGLEPATTYEYRAVSEDGNTGEIEEKSTTELFREDGGVQTFSTSTLFDVSISDVNDPVVEGEDLQVEALVENTGAEGSDTVELEVPGVGTDDTSLNLESGESEVVELTVSTSSGDGGSFTANVSSSEDFTEQGVFIGSIEPPIEPDPGGEVVGLEEEVSAEANASAEVDMTVEFYLEEDDEFIGSEEVSTGERASASLESVDLDTGSSYSYYALAEFGGSTEESSSWSFSTVEEPSVTELEPEDESVDVDSNPELNVTVDGNALINVSFYNFEGDGFEPGFLGSEEVDPGEEASFDLEETDDLGDQPTNRWVLELESKGTTWNNSDDPYSFSTSDISSIDYNPIELDSGDNLNPGSTEELDNVIGPEEVVFEVTNPQGLEMNTLGLNVTAGSETEQFEYVQDIDSGENAVFDVTESDILEENVEGAELNVFYQEGQEVYSGDDFVSDSFEFSTHVAELEWSHPSPEALSGFRVYYNESSTAAVEDYTEIDTVTPDETNIGVANRDLEEDGEEDCYQIEAFNPFDTSDPANVEEFGDECLGGDDP